MSGKETKSMIDRIDEITKDAKTLADLQTMLQGIAYAVGGMVCHFNKDDRSQMLMNLTQAMGMGLMLTSKAIGEPSDIEIVVGGRTEE